jgi:hypothetical protein
MLLLNIRGGQYLKNQTDAVLPKKKMELDIFSHAVFSLLDFMRDGTDWFSQNVGKELSLYAA